MVGRVGKELGAIACFLPGREYSAYLMQLVEGELCWRLLEGWISKELFNEVGAKERRKIDFCLEVVTGGSHSNSRL